MKIQQSHGVSHERFIPVREKGKETSSFQQVFQEKQLNLSQDRLQLLLKELDQNGTRLSISKSMQDLMAYKKAIRDFLKEVVQNGFSLEEHKGFHPNGRDKRMKLIKQVDQHLVELSQQVLENQASSVDLVKKIGEIKGLIVNLYM